MIIAWMPLNAESVSSTLLKQLQALDSAETRLDRWSRAGVRWSEDQPEQQRATHLGTAGWNLRKGAQARPFGDYSLRSAGGRDAM